MKKNSNKGTGVRALILAVLTLTAMSVLAPRSHAINLEDAHLRVLNAIGSAARVNSADSGEGVMTITYTGTGSDPVVTISATAMTFYSAYGVLDTTIGTAGVVTFSASGATLGALCDFIEAETYYSCRLTGGRRADLPILLKDQTAASGLRNLSAPAGYGVQFEGASGGGDGSAYTMRLGITPTTGRRVVLKKCITTNTGTGTFLVYGKLRKFEGASDGITRNDSTLVWSEPTADATALTQDWSIAGGIGGGVEFGVNEHVVVAGGNVATQQLAASNIECLWDER